MAHVTLITYDAASFHLPSSAAPGLDVVQNRTFLAFDDTTVENAKTRPATMPGQYAAGTLKCSIYYTMATATADDVEFEVSVEAITDADAFDLDGAEDFDSVNSITATVPGTAGYLDVLTGTLTNKDLVAAGDLMRIKLERDADDATNDDATGDCRVYAVEIWEET